MAARNDLDDLLALSGELRAESEDRARPDVLADCFPEQLSFIRDQSPLKFALTTRRAAKTYSVGLQMVNDSYDFPNATYLFIGLVREVARRIFWKDVLKSIDKRHQLGAEFNESSLTMRMPNGAEIVILGADADEQQRDKLLGGKYRIVCVDEAASWTTDLRELVTAVLGPATLDYDGQIILTGTPGNLYQGYFREVTNGCSARFLSPPEVREPGWSGHTWTTDKNTTKALGDSKTVAEKWGLKLERLKRENPRITETKAWAQMYEGRWVVDEDELVYRFRRTRNTFTELPRYSGGAWHFVISCDLGYSDAGGLLLGAWHDWDRHLYFIRSWKEWAMDISSTVARVHMLEETVRSDFGQEIETYLVDGSNRQAVEEMRKRHQVAFLAADKRGKEDFIELMNDEFTMGYILVDLEGCSGGVLNSGRKADSLGIADEYETLTWDLKHRTPGQRKEFHPPLENALCDCALYLWRYAYTYIARAPEARPVAGTAEALAVEVEHMWSAEREALVERKPEPVGLGDSSRWDPRLN